MHLAPRLQELLGDLGARLAGADHQHAAPGEQPRPPVLVRVHLLDVTGELPRGARHLGPLVGAGGQHDAARLDGRVRDARGEAGAGGAQAGDGGAEPDRRADRTGVGGDVVHHLLARHEPVRVAPAVRHAGQQEGEVGCDQAEAVPAVVPSAAQALTPLHDQVLDARLGQPVARGQPGLTAADHERVDRFSLVHVATVGTGRRSPRREKGAIRRVRRWVIVCSRARRRTQWRPLWTAAPACPGCC